MELFDAEMLAKELISRYVPHYSFGWMNEKQVNGRCFYVKKIIKLSRPRTLLRSPEAVRHTIMHEIAHALTPGTGHGISWKKQMWAFGLPANRCSQDQVDISSISNWKAVCPGCSRVTYMIRKPRAVRSCGRCTSKFDSRYILTYRPC